MGMAYNSELEIANEFLRRAADCGHALTHMQLQKLVYIANGWSLALLGAPLTTNEPRAWDYGPVYPDLWHQLKRYGSAPIKSPLYSPFGSVGDEELQLTEYNAKLSPEEEQLVDEVWRSYGQMDGLELSQLTHQPGTPWFQVFSEQGNRSGVIAHDLVQNHYSELAEAANDSEEPA